jgi:hypothetical protein
MLKLTIFSSLRSMEKTPWFKYLRLRARRITVNVTELEPELSTVKNIVNREYREAR